MRILSKRNEKDYYDNGAVYGIDKTKVYVRIREEHIIHHDDYDLDKYLFNRYWSNKEERSFEILGFCGQLYLMDNFSLRDYQNGWHREPKDHILYDNEISDYYFEKTGEDIFGNSTYKKVERDKNKKYRRDVDDEYLRKIKNNKIVKELFVKHQTPIFVISPRKEGLTVITNPLLKDYGFFRIKDTIQTFQEIEMFLGSVLVSDTQVDVPVGDDKTIAASKGFDEWSFRKEPTKHKNK